MDVGDIEAGIPIPAKRGRSVGPVFKRVTQLKVGESFLISTENHRWQAHYAARKLGIVVVVRTLADGGKRVWRVA